MNEGRKIDCGRIEKWMKLRERREKKRIVGFLEVSLLKKRSIVLVLVNVKCTFVSGKNIK